MNLNDEFEIPKDELEALDKVRSFYYRKDLYGLILYIKKLLEVADFKYKK